MPVKSSKNKKTENDIKEVVDKIPGLIFEQVEFKKKSEEKISKNNYQKEKKKKTMVWIGVITLAMIILVMWGWSTFVNFDTLIKNKKESIFDQAKEDLKNIKQESNKPAVTTTTEETNKLNDQEIEAKIKNSLNIIIKNLNTSTPSTTANTTSSDETVKVL